MSDKTYRQLQTELDDVLSQMQSSEMDIDEAIKLYKQGEKLLASLSKKLEVSKNEIKKLTSK